MTDPDGVPVEFSPRPWLFIAGLLFWNLLLGAWHLGVQVPSVAESRAIVRLFVFADGLVITGFEVLVPALIWAFICTRAPRRLLVPARCPWTAALLPLPVITPWCQYFWCSPPTDTVDLGSSVAWSAGELVFLYLIAGAIIAGVLFIRDDLRIRPVARA